MSKKIEITEWLSRCDESYRLEQKLWLTPGSSTPYWASNASFTYDEVVATPWDFLDAVGYTSFNDDGDYDHCDEQITIEVDYIEYVDHC